MFFHLLRSILFYCVFAHCRLERSTDQVIKPINLEALSKWVGQIPEDVVRDMAEIAPMLQTLGYDPFGNPPDYGRPDSVVVKKMEEMKQNQDVWKQRESEAVHARESIRQTLLRDKESVASDHFDHPSDHENEAIPDASIESSAKNIAAAGDS